MCKKCLISVNEQINKACFTHYKAYQYLYGDFCNTLTKSHHKNFILNKEVIYFDYECFTIVLINVLFYNKIIKTLLCIFILPLNRKQIPKRSYTKCKYTL